MEASPNTPQARSEPHVPIQNMGMIAEPSPRAVLKVSMVGTHI